MPDVRREQPAGEDLEHEDRGRAHEHERGGDRIFDIGAVLQPDTQAPGHRCAATRSS